MKKIDAVQDLRGLAVLYVILFHAGSICEIEYFVHGASGVALFFVISGFIISAIHKNDRGLKPSGLFIKKRIARIYSPYLIPLLIVIVLFFMSGKGSEYHRDGINILRNIFLIQAPSKSIHPYSWSLVFEIYYYFTFCLFVILLRINVLAYVLIMSTPPLLSMLIMSDVGKDIVPLNFSNLFFCIGAIFGIFYEKIKYEPGLFLVLFAFVFFIGVPFFDLGPFIFLIATSALFLTYSKSSKSNLILKEIGNASYSIYLIHAITLMTMKTLIESRSIFVFLSMVFVSIAISYLYYLFIEKPFISKSYKILNIKKLRVA